jgi:NDP-hexose-3-ketoreductase
MQILILGYSDIVRRRVIPSLLKLSDITSVEIASKSTNLFKEIIENKYDDYDQAIKSSNAELVYISLPNNLHYRFSKLALLNNKNVIVDKPAITNKNQLSPLIKLSFEKNLAISMSSVFNHHKCWNKFKKISLNENDQGTLSISFTIPKLNKENIRMSKKLHGGAINDMAIYASNIGQLFWEKNLEKLTIYKQENNDLVVGFNLIASYGKNKEMIGTFGFEKLYKNEVNYFGNNFNTCYERVFSPPPDFKTKIIKETNNKKNIIEVGNDDTFLNYFRYVLENIKNDKHKLTEEFIIQNKEYLKYII